MQNLIQRLLCSPAAVFLCFFGLIAGLKWSVLSLPPVWDEAVSVFAAADHLSSHSFNVAAMLAEPARGAHWLSLMSFLSAAVMAVLKGGAAWMLLHLLQWLMGAAACTLLLRLLEPVAGRAVAWAATLLFLAAPVTLAQLGCMYIELPLVMFCLLAVSLHLSGRTGWALLACLLACFTKESGFLAPAALGVAALLEARSWRAGLARFSGYVAPCLLVVLVTAFCVARVGSGQPAGVPRELLASFWEMQGETARSCWLYMPDHPVLLALAGLLATAVLLRLLRARRRDGVDALAAPFTRLALVAALFLGGFLFLFLVLLPLAWDNANYLPRYLVQALPFLLILILFAFGAPSRRRVATAVLLALAALCLANRRGSLYPRLSGNNIALAERSEEYVDGYRVTRDLLAAIERGIPPDLPVLFCQPTHLLTQHPAFGYVSRALPNAVNVLDPVRAAAYRSGRPGDLPDRFVLVYDYPRLGGRRILSLLKDARSPDSLFEQRQAAVFPHGAFNALVVEIARKTTPGSGAPHAAPVAAP